MVRSEKLKSVSGQKKAICRKKMIHAERIDHPNLQMALVFPSLYFMFYVFSTFVLSTYLFHCDFGQFCVDSAHYLGVVDELFIGEIFVIIDLVQGFHGLCIFSHVGGIIDHH